MERVICEQLNDFIEKHDYLYELQSGFCSSYSTDSCLVHLSDHILKQQDKGQYTGMAILDLQKAFDTVNHKILNRLPLQLDKTESILFGFNKRLAKRRVLQITCNGNDIESGAKVTYLGVTLDQNLSGSSMITKIVSKCNNKIKFLYRNAKSLDKKKMLLASALVQCHFDYLLIEAYSQGFCTKRLS